MAPNQPKTLIAGKIHNPTPAGIFFNMLLFAQADHGVAKSLAPHVTIAPEKNLVTTKTPRYNIALHLLVMVCMRSPMPQS
jgi:hypothetical protein